MNRLEGKTIAVTGAGSGIGRAMALAFGNEGAHVLVADIRREAREGGDPTDAVLASRGQAGEYVETDVSQWADVDALVTRAVAVTGKLDVFVNNAALHHRSVSKSLLETEPEDWDAMMAVNLRGTFFGCKRAIQQMLMQEPVGDVRGRVINMASEHGLVGAPGHVAYSAMKGAVVNLTRQVAVDFAEHGIVCNAIAPGKIVVPREGGQDAELLSYAHARTPWPRLGEPEDVAALAVFLASDDCRFMTGANVLIDGGFMAY